MPLIKNYSPIDISETGLGDVVHHRTRGPGVVFKCSEEPKIWVQFDTGPNKAFNEKQALKDLASEPWEGMPDDSY